MAQEDIAAARLAKSSRHRLFVDDGRLFARKAGSAERSEAGTNLATSLFVDVVRESLTDGTNYIKGIGELIRYASEQARAAIEMLAACEARDIGDFACTLLVALLHEQGGAVAQIGDGAIVAAGGSEAGWRPMLWA